MAGGGGTYDTNGLRAASRTHGETTTSLLTAKSSHVGDSIIWISLHAIVRLQGLEETLRELLG